MTKRVLAVGAFALLAVSWALALLPSWHTGARVYSLAELHASMARVPGRWAGRTVLVRGVVLTLDRDISGATLLKAPVDDLAAAPSGSVFHLHLADAIPAVPVPSAWVDGGTVALPQADFEADVTGLRVRALGTSTALLDRVRQFLRFSPAQGVQLGKSRIYRIRILPRRGHCLANGLCICGRWPCDDAELVGGGQAGAG